MPDKENTWGGKRDGAGRPVENFTLKRGREYGFVFPPIKRGKIIDIDRKTVKIKFEDGTTLTIFV